MEIAPARLVLEGDPTTLFTSSGMQPLVPYLLGEKHPSGSVRLVDSQPSFRTEDIAEVGDNRHTTFFEMLGNWSLGDYFKKEQLAWFYQYLTQELKLDSNRLYVTVFKGGEFIPKDEESYQTWKELGVKEDRIFFYGVEKNWWSKFGKPDNMPAGEIGGPDSEVFYDFGTPHDPKFGKNCHPNCDCGRFLEIGNSVFIQYQKQSDGSFKKLEQQNVDFGGGLERLTAATLNNPDIFQTDLYWPIIQALEKHTGRSYHEEDNRPFMRVVADHMKAATFLILNGVEPGNKMQGYVLRRILRRSAVKIHQLTREFTFLQDLNLVAEQVLEIYDGLFEVENNQANRVKVSQMIKGELGRFSQTLEKGLRQVNKMERVDGKKAFDLYQSYGFPWEITEELFRQKGEQIDRRQFEAEFEKHRQLSRTASSGVFKGGLAGHSEIEIKYHTATHLLHQALRDVLGPQVFQKGSNINQERLRFDFSFDRKMTDEEVSQVEKIVNKRIEENLVVDHMIVPAERAKKLNAIGLFGEKYGQEVSVYAVGPNFKLDLHAKDQRERGGYYSVEFCGGPHVKTTKEIGKMKITKEEAVSAGVRRIRAQLV